MSLKKGIAYTPGEYRLICDINDIDYISNKNISNQLDKQDAGLTSFIIKNNPRNRITNRLIIPDLELGDGEYQVLNDEDSYLCDVKIQGDTIFGIKLLLEQSEGQDVTIKLVNEVFVVTQI